MTRVYQRSFGPQPRWTMLGPVPCQGCRTLVYWARGITRAGWDGPQVPGSAWWREKTGRIHRCANGKRDGRFHGRAGFPMAHP